MNDLQKLAKSMIENGGFTAKPSVSVFDQTFEKQVGFDQLTALADRTGNPNYATGRAFSPSSLKKVHHHPLKYIEYVKEKPQTQAERLEVFYNSGKRHFAIGQVFEDMLRHGIEKTADELYVPESGTLTPAVKKAAHESGRKAVRAADWEKCIQMHLTVKEVAPEYVERLRVSSFEAPAYDTVKVGPNEIQVGGYLDSFYAPDKYASDIKTIEKMSDAEKRIFERNWGTFQYWLQPAIYDIRFNFKKFEFMFVSKDEHPSVMLISFGRDQLDQLREYLLSTVLSEVAFYLENGFQTQTSQFWGKMPRIEPETRLFV